MGTDKEKTKGSSKPSKDKSNDDKKISKIKKPTWYLIFIAVMTLVVIIIASAVIYSVFFKTSINRERNKQIATDYMTETLHSNSEEASKHRETNDKIIDKYKLNIFGRYSCTFNEAESEGSGYTTPITSVMELKSDYTAEFEDGTAAWWMLSEDENGIVHLGLVDPDDKTPQIYLISDGALIDETKACFIGKIPESSAIEGTFSAGNLTLEFNKDGTVNGEYSEIVKENDTEYPYTEAYSGTYKRNGSYLDITLNGADARYYIFSTVPDSKGKSITGFASRYYLKSDAQ